MLNTQMLCARVTMPGRSEKRTISVTTASLEMAQALKSKGLADKTTTRCLTDALLAALDECDTRNPATKKAVARWIDESDKLIKSRTMFSLEGTAWKRLEALAKAQDVTVTQVVRALSHVAVKQVHDELINR